MKMKKKKKSEDIICNLDTSLLTQGDTIKFKTQ